MHHLQRNLPFEYTQVPTPKVTQEPAIPQQLELGPARQTDNGNLHAQASDYWQPHQDVGKCLVYLEKKMLLIQGSQFQTEQLEIYSSQP